MSSSEEYLDSLLKSLTEGGNTAGTESGVSILQNTADDLQNSDVTESAASDAADATMSMDDIEAMFASMGMDAQEEEPAADETSMNIADEQSFDDGMIADEQSLDDGIISDELGVEETSLSDEMLSENVGMEGQASDDLALIDEMLSDELPLESEAASDDIALSEESVTDDLMLEESAEEEPVADEPSLDELGLEDLGLEGLGLEESAAEEPVADDLVLEESVEEESVADDLMLEESAEEEPVADEPSLDELGLEDLGLEGLGLEEFAIEEPVADDLVLEESAEEEPVADEPSLDELGLEDLGLESLGLEELGLEEAGQETEEEQLALEEGAEEESMALEDTGEEDADLSALLASMGGDEDLSEISDLLEKSEQGVAVDDDMMAMLGGLTDTEEGEGEGEESFDFFSGEEKEDGSKDIREITPEELEERENPKTKKKEEKERKKREKKAKKKKGGESEQGENADGESSDDLSNLLGDGDENAEPKKQGLFARFISFLLEEDEEGDSVEGDSEDVGVVIGSLSDENKELLEELNEEDRKNAKKKEKADKKKNKKDKGKKKGGKAGAGGESDEESDAKPKKPKKEKKKKEKSIEDELKLPVKKLSKKKVTSVFLFCATIAACIIVLTMLLPPQMEKQEARVAFDRSQYEQVYALLYGKELDEEDEAIFKKSSIILKMQRKLDSYENYKKMDMQPEALNALIEGVSRYQNLSSDAAAYNVGSEVADIYGQILAVLARDYGLSEADALNIISSGDDVTYSQRIQAVISGEVYGTEEALPEGRQDVLPEEEEIIERLDNIDTAE